MFKLSISESGLPVAQPSASLKRNLRGAAQATLQARHPGPRKDPSDILQRLVDQPPPLVDISEVEDVEQIFLTPSLARDSDKNEENVEVGYDPNNPYYEGATDPRFKDQQLAGRPKKSIIRSTVVQQMPGTSAESSRPSERPSKPYQLSCRKCSWKTIEALEGSALVGLVAQLKYHDEDEHSSDQGPSSSSNSGSAEREEFRVATTPRIIPASKDDRVNLFSPGRFLMGPINWRNLARQAPIVQEPVYSNLDLWHIGIPSVNKKVAVALHDRATRNLKLDKFSMENLTRRQEQKKFSLNHGEMIEGQGYSEITKTGDALLSAYNYLDLMREFHPTDIGPRSLFRTVLTNYVENRITSPGPIRRFFMSVTEENAGRACRTEPSLNYDEASSRWSGVNQATYGIPDNRKRAREGEEEGQAQMAAVLSNLTRTLGSLAKNKSPSPASKKAKKVVSGGPYCKHFNTVAGCPNVQSTQGCIGPDRTPYVHSCNLKVPPGNRICGNKDHNALNHQ